MVTFPLTYPIWWTGLAGFSLNVTKLSNKNIVVKASTDDWVSNVYVKKQRVYGDYETFVLNCFEKSVVWDNSVAKRLQEAALAGDAVRLYFITPPRDIDIQVFVIDLKVMYELGAPNIRRFTVVLKEDMN